MPTPAYPETSPAGKRRIRVLIVDDSALVRSLLTDILRADPGIEVVGAASDAHVAREKIKQLNPDVLTLDVEMPKMDGITFLKNDSEELIEKIKTASRASVRALDAARAGTIAVRPKFSTDAVLPRSPGSRQLRTTDRIIAIGASTGGTEAIKDVLTKLPPDTPGVVIAQHIPKAFSTPFAKRMNDCCQMTVYEAEDGQQVLAGHVYIAPGDRHLMVVRDGARYVLRLDDGVPVNRHKPSVDVLFRSVAQNAGRNAIGVILTGMGKDR